MVARHRADAWDLCVLWRQSQLMLLDSSYSANSRPARRADEFCNYSALLLTPRLAEFATTAAASRDRVLRMRRIGFLAGLVSTILVAALLTGSVACSSKTPSSSTSQQGLGTIVVFAAASLRPSFTKIRDKFKADNPGSDVTFDFLGSSELATQLTQGATADVFASADTKQMDVVVKAGLVDGTPANFASNTLVIVTAPGNPKKIASFADLAKPGLSVVTCQKPVPCGAATLRVEDSTGVRLNPVSEEGSVTDVLNKVTTGQADAALVYITDAQSAGEKVTAVKFPEAAGAVNVYPIAVLKKAPQPALAQKWVTLVTGDAGQQILAQSGFQKP
jgi:molybdate transport system substrate-binding protein